MYNSLFFSIFTELYNHDHDLIMELFFFTSPKETPYPLAFMLSSPGPWHQETTNLLSVSMDLPI